MRTEEVPPYTDESSVTIARGPRLGISPHELAPPYQGGFATGIDLYSNTEMAS